jgi:hypothetical protein
VQVTGSDLWSVGVAVSGGVGTVYFVVKWVAKQVDDLKHSAQRARDDEKQASKAAEARCQQTNDDLAKRLRFLEDQSHNENRQDRVVMLKILEMNATAFHRFAEKLPESITPPNGNPTLN